MTDVVSQVPLSFPQQLLTFLEVLHPASAFGPSFLISGAYRLRGIVDSDALRAATRDVVARHDALRSVVRFGDGVPWQEFSPSAGERFGWHDLDTPSPAARDDVVSAFLDELDARGFPARQPPLLWVFLGRLADDDHVLVLVVHHSVADAWSMDVLVGDLVSAYEARVTGTSLDLGPAPSYADFARADQASDTALREGAMAYWQDQLADVPVSSLPMGERRRIADSVAKTRLRFEIPPELAVELADVGRRTRTSAFIVQLGAYLTVLRHMTGAEDFAVPTLTSGRGRPSVDRTVGFFLNALVLRTNLAGDPSLGELLARVRRTCLEAYRHEIPVLRLIESVPDAGLLLADERFALLPFQHIPTPRAVESLPFGPACDYRPFRRAAGRQERGVAVPLDGLWTTQADSAGGLAGMVTFTAGLFEESAMRTAVDGFQAVLRQLTTDLELPLSRVRI